MKFFIVIFLSFLSFSCNTLYQKNYNVTTKGYKRIPPEFGSNPNEILSITKLYVPNLNKGEGGSFEYKQFNRWVKKYAKKHYVGKIKFIEPTITTSEKYDENKLNRYVLIFDYVGYNVSQSGYSYYKNYSMLDRKTNTVYHGPQNTSSSGPILKAYFVRLSEYIKSNIVE